MRILFLSTWYPYPANNGSKLRVYNLLRGLAEGHELTLLSFADSSVPAEPPSELRAICRAVHVVRQRPYNPSSGRSLLGLFSSTPRVVVDTFSREMHDRLRFELDRTPYDLVIASQWNTASYLEHIRGIPAIFEEVEVGVLVTKVTNAGSPFERFRHQLTLVKLRSYLRRLLPRFAACTVVSEAEASLLRQMVPTYTTVHVVPNAVDVAEYADIRSVPQPKTLIFAGSLRYFANHDAMDWFLRESYPLIQSRVPDVRLTITGDHADLPLPSSSNLILRGFVDDVRPLIASSWVSLAPIRVGGGTRLKILEAMALRSPVVATSKGAEGLEARNGEHLLIADDPRSYANAVIRLLEEPDLRDQLAGNGFALVKTRYDWNVVLPILEAILERARGDPSSRR